MINNDDNDIIDINKIKEVRKKYHDSYTLKNRDTLNVKHICSICNGKYSLYNKAHHFLTKKHIKLIGG